MRHRVTAQVTALIAAALVVWVPMEPLFAQRSRGSVSAASRGTTTRSGNTTTRTSAGGNVSGSRTVSQTGDGYNVNKQVQTQGGASKSVSKDIDTDDRTVDRSSTTTNQWGQSASRDRTVEGQGGYATVEGSASTSTGREASAQGAVGRNAYGQPAYAGTVNTKYNGNYATAGARNPYGGWTKATVGPYGGKVTTTLPSGYRTSMYYGRSYYTYGGAYYRPYAYHGVHYYYPVPPPYYAYYSSPPVGAIVLMVAGVAYFMSKDGSYSKQTTNSSGTVVYQSVPPPAGASIKTLPAERVLVTVSGTTYFLYSNAFYKRVMNGAQESFVTVTPPAGVVFLPALPADFEVVQLNTMYFNANGTFYVPFMSGDGKELFAMVDRPPTPPASPVAAAPGATAAPAAAPAPAPPVQAVAESMAVPAGTQLMVRLKSDLSSATASVGAQFQGFLDRDLMLDGRLVAPRGGTVYGAVIGVERGTSGRSPSLTVTLLDMKVGSRVLPIKTQPITRTASAGTGAVIPAQTPQGFTLTLPIQVDLMTNVAVR
jgi:hypothetical protein